ncbi:MAG: class I SAM-dependent methyltransferase [Acidobacteriota bacterium]|nr:class I SAM-dependent methyltransferase [Acidobacteriota bacterium]
MLTAEYRRNYELEQSYWWFVGVRAIVDRLLDGVGLDGSLGRVLDVGCGTGALLEGLRTRSTEAWGVDIAPEALRFCAERGLQCVTLADAAAVPFPSGYFDVVTAIGIVEHLEDDQAFLAEMNRLVRPGGVLVLLTSSFPWLWSMHDVANRHRRRYYLTGLRDQMRRAGFEAVRLSHMNFLLFPALAPALLIHRRIFGLRSERARRILPRPPRLVNALLTAVLRLESRLIRRMALPWGVSLIGSFRRVSGGAAGA